jgi:hypothetical protein
MADRTVTVGPTGDYASLNAAFAGEDGYNCVTNTGDLIIQCQNFQDTTVVNYTSGTGITTDATYGVRVEALNDHGGKWSTSAYRLDITTNVSQALTIGAELCEHLHLKGLQFRIGGTTGGAPCVKATGTPTTGLWQIEKCILIADDTTAYKRGMRLEEANLDYHIWNTVIYGTGLEVSSAGLNIVTSTAGVFIYNCTIDTIATGIDAAGSNVRAKNTRITNVTTVCDQSMHADSDYNLTDGTAPTNWGTNSIDSTDTPTIDYVDDANATLTSRDYHLGATDSGIDAGTDLSADTDLSFTDDIDGETRG